MRTYKGIIKELPENGITVFEAKYGNRRGIQYKRYAIVTKDLSKRIHPSVTDSEIKEQIELLYHFAIKNSHLDFYVAYSGTGNNLNGYSNQEMADMFSSFSIPENIIFEEEFSKLLKSYDNNR